MSKESSKYRILLADDHQIVRQGLRWILDEIIDSYELHQASSVKQLLSISNTYLFDLIVLDAQFPDGNALQAIPKIRENQTRAKILVFTSFKEEDHALKFLDVGANGFLSKESSDTEITLALKNMTTLGEHHSPLTKALLKMSEQNPILLSPLNALSARELEIAKLLAQGLGNLEIANSLDLKQNTVSTFKSRIITKLGVNSLLELVELVQKHDLDAGPSL